MALDGTYNITVSSPMGPQAGTIALATDGGTVTGSIAAMGVASELQNGVAEGDSFTAFMEGDFQPMGHLKVGLKGTVTGDDIVGTMKMGPMDFSLKGTRA